MPTGKSAGSRARDSRGGNTEMGWDPRVGWGRVASLGRDPPASRGAWHPGLWHLHPASGTPLGLSGPPCVPADGAPERFCAGPGRPSHLAQPASDGRSGPTALTGNQCLRTATQDPDTPHPGWLKLMRSKLSSGSPGPWFSSDASRRNHDKIVAKRGLGSAHSGSWAGGRRPRTRPHPLRAGWGAGP